MKLTTVFLLALVLNVSAKTYSQKITLNLQHVPLEKAIEEIRKQSGYKFLYNDELLKKANKVSIKISNSDVSEALTKILAGTQLSFKIVDNTIVISPRQYVDTGSQNKVSLIEEAAKSTITGTVTDAQGKPMENVSVVNKNTKKRNGYKQRRKFFFRSFKQRYS